MAATDSASDVGKETLSCRQLFQLEDWATVYYQNVSGVRRTDICVDSPISINPTPKFVCTVAALWSGEINALAYQS